MATKAKTNKKVAKGTKTSTAKTGTKASPGADLQNIALKSKIINEVIGNLYMTYDYDQFKLMQGNRPTNMAHVQQLMKSFEQKQLIVPVIVNHKMEIIDGQHRVEVCRQTNLPVYFIILKDYGIKEVQMLNTNMKNWSVDDYLNCYCSLGIDDYIKYREFRAKYSFDHQATLAFLVGNTNKYTQIFNEGNLKIKSYPKAQEVAQKISDFGQYYKGYKRKSFVYALLNLLKHPQYDHKEMLEKLSFQQTKLVDCTTKDQYLYLLEEIYNFRRRGERVIFRA